MQRAVRFLAGEAGIRQIIDIGTGIPSAGNVHEVAGQVAPDARVVYVDNDPIVHVHANALLSGSGTTSIVLADLRDPTAILEHPKLRGLIDFTQPVALLLVAILHFITDAENPAGIVATLRDALPEGSYLALSHGTGDFHPPGTEGRAASAYQNATAPLVLRTLDQVLAFFDGFELVEPGLVQAPLWRPDGKPPRPEGAGEDRHLRWRRPQEPYRHMTRPPVPRLQRGAVVADAWRGPRHQYRYRPIPDPGRRQAQWHRLEPEDHHLRRDRPAAGHSSPSRRHLPARGRWQATISQ